MAGLFSYSAAGLGFLLIAAIEALLPFKPLRSSVPLDLPFLRYLSILLLSSLSILYSLLSSLPELLFLDLRRHDLDGVESRDFDLLLVPVLLCLASTALSLARPRSPFPRLARAVGLALHGTWLLQMAFSFFSSAVAHGCFLHRRSWANYTIRCKGHQEYHRGRAIATLQFNCHLALLVVVAVGVYSAVVNSGGGPRGGVGYRPLNKELQRMSNGDLAKFSLEDEEEIKDGDVAVPVSEMRNGFNGSH